MSEAQGQGKQSLVEMLKAMVQARASDIHLQAGAPPTVRIDGKLRPFGNRPLTPKEVEAIARALLTPEQLEELEYRKEMDAAGDGAFAVMHPMVGGVPPDLGWRHLRPFEKTFLEE